MGTFLRDVMKLNLDSKNFRLFSPDENNSNRWQDVLEVTTRCYMADIYPDDDKLSPDGRVMEVLSEHPCQGWLEGYLLTGRHGFFSCYEAFVHIVDSMFNQHAKWLKTCNHIPWRRPIASFNYFLNSHVWRQDHNGLSHQDPGFIDHVVNKKAEVIRVYLPPDANCLLWVTDQCLRSRNNVNVLIAGKQPAPQCSPKRLSFPEIISARSNGCADLARDRGRWPDNRPAHPRWIASPIRADLICDRDITRSTRDRNNPRNSDHSSLQASHIGRQDHPIRRHWPTG